MDEERASVPRDDEGIGEEVGELADGRTIRFFSWVTPRDEPAEET
ncbi:hypothetical protein [Actinomycetospora chibensis]|nr:hypothetical protein [Actinomycetospora chibensis]